MGGVVFISINDALADDLTNYTTLAVTDAFTNTASITCTAKLLTTDYFALGFYYAGAGAAGLPAQVRGSFTMNYIST